jgi:metal-sulfur cluster biosynthetic enzyme
MSPVTRAEVEEVLRTTYDPDLDIDLQTLGLIYGYKLDEAAQTLKITMTFTTPLCPYGGDMVTELKRRFTELGMKEEAIEIEVTFTPPWEPPEGIREMLGV